MNQKHFDLTSAFTIVNWSREVYAVFLPDGLEIFFSLVLSCQIGLIRHCEMRYCASFLYF
jgi:hypothetical protein